MRILSQNKQLQKVLQNQETQVLLRYFWSLQKPAMLREIRQQLPELKHLDQQLDQLILHRVVQRENRRYQLSLPCYQSYPESSEYFEISALCQQFPQKEVLYFLVENFYQAAPVETIAVDFLLPQRTKLANDDYQLVTINQSEPQALTLPNYFSYQAEMAYPVVFETLEKLIGDVNQAFFMNQIGMIFDFVLKGKAPRRKTIYLESLLLTDSIQLTPEIKLNLPVLTADENNFSALTEKLKHLPEEVRFFVVNQLIQELLTQESWTYLIKKA